MLTKNEFMVLACFFPRLETITARELEQKTGLTHEPVFRMLQNLVKERILIAKKIGQTNLYEINKAGEYFYQIFVHYATERRLAFKSKHNLLYRRIYEFLNEAQPKEFAILFGSYAKGTETPRSDVDILIIDTNKDRINTVAKTYNTKYGIALKVLVVAPGDFKNIKNHNTVFWNDLIFHGIILDGLDYFFRRVYR